MIYDSIDIPFETPDYMDTAISEDGTFETIGPWSSAAILRRYTALPSGAPLQAGEDYVIYFKDKDRADDEFDFFNVVHMPTEDEIENGGTSTGGGGKVQIGTRFPLTNWAFGQVVEHNLDIAEEDLNYQFYIGRVRVGNFFLKYIDRNHAAVLFPQTNGTYQNQNVVVYIWDSSVEGPDSEENTTTPGTGIASWDQTLGVKISTNKVPESAGHKFTNLPVAQSSTNVLVQLPNTKEVALMGIDKVTNTPGPTPISIPDQNLIVGTYFEYVHDAFVGAVNYRAENLPPGIDYSPSERKFYGTPTTERDEKWQVTLTAYSANNIPTAVTSGFKVFPQGIAKAIDFVYWSGVQENNVNSLRLYLFGAGNQGDLKVQLVGRNGTTYDSGVLSWVYDPGKWAYQNLFDGKAPYTRLIPGLAEGDYTATGLIGTSVIFTEDFTYDHAGKGRLYPHVDETNLLTGKPVTASSSATGVPENSNDGNDNTSWASIAGNQPVIQYDLQADYLMDTLRLRSPDTFGTIYMMGFLGTPPPVAAGTLDDALNSPNLVWAYVLGGSQAMDYTITQSQAGAWNPIRYVRIQKDDGFALNLTEASMTGTAKSNPAPQLVTPFGSSTVQENSSSVIDLSGHIVDPEGETITHTAKLKSGLPLPSFLALSADGKLTITNAPYQGLSSQSSYAYDIVITGSDPGGAQISGDYQLTVNKIDTAPDSITYAGYHYDINNHYLTPQFNVTGGNWLVSVRGVGVSYNEIGHATKTGAFVTELSRITYNRESTPFAGIQQGNTYEIEYYQVNGESLKRTVTIPTYTYNFDQQLHPTTGTGGGGGDTPTGDTITWAGFHPDVNSKTLTPMFTVSGGSWAVSVRGITNTGYSQLAHAATAGSYTSETKGIAYNRQAVYFSGLVGGQTYEIEYYQPNGGTSKKIQFVFPSAKNDDIELTIPGGGTDPGKPTISSVYLDATLRDTKHFIVPRAEATGDVQFLIQQVGVTNGYYSGWQNGVKAAGKSYYEYTNTNFMLDGSYTITVRLISDNNVTRTTNTQIVTFIKTIAIAPNPLIGGVCTSVSVYVELDIPTGRVERTFYAFPDDFGLMTEISNKPPYTHYSSAGSNSASTVNYDSDLREFKFRIQGTTNIVKAYYKRNGDAVGTVRVVYTASGGSTGDGGGTVTPPSNFVPLPQVAIPTGTWKLNNGTVEVGFNKEFGSSIMHLAKAGGVNLVNNPVYPSSGPDKTGRQVQTSLYRSPYGYRQGNAAVDPQYPDMPDNLLDGGSSKQQATEILYRGFKDNVEYIRSRPKQWALDNVTDNTIYEKWVWAEGNVIKVHQKVTLDSANNTTDPLRPLFQEMPCLYLQGNFKSGKLYTGGSPWSSGVVETVDLTTIPSLDNNVTKFGSESWAALSDPNTGLTVALYTPKSCEYRFSYAGDKNEPVVENASGNSGYLAAAAYHIWGKKDAYEWDYQIVIGDSVDAVRSKIATFPRPDNRPKAVFNDAYFTRQGWTTYFATDKSVTADSWELKNHEFENGAEAHNPDGTNIFSPAAPFLAADTPKLYIKTKANSTSALRIYFAKFDQDLQNPRNTGQSVQISFTSDDQYRVYEINMASHGSWNGWIGRLCANWVNDAEQDPSIKWIDTVNRDAGTTNQPPTISFLSPASGAEILTGASVDIEFNANDSDGSVAQVETFINGSKIGTDQSAPWKISPSLAGYAPGDYTLKGIVTDNKGATAEVTRTIRVKSTTPTPQPGNIVRRLVSCQRGFGAGDVPDILDYHKGFFDRGGNGIQIVIKSTDWKRGERFYDSIINHAVGRGASIEIILPLMQDSFDLPSWLTLDKQQMMGTPTGATYYDDSYRCPSFYYIDKAMDGNNPFARWIEDLFGGSDNVISRYGSVIDWMDTGTGQAMELGYGVRAAGGQLVATAGYENLAKTAWQDDLVAYYGNLGNVNAALLPGTPYTDKSQIVMPNPGQYFEANGRAGQALLAQREGRVRMVQAWFENQVRSRSSRIQIQTGMGQTQSAQGRWYATQNAATLSSTAQRAVENFSITDNWKHVDRLKSFKNRVGVELDGSQIQNGVWVGGLSDWDVQYLLRDAAIRGVEKENFFAFRNERVKIYQQVVWLAEFGFPGSLVPTINYSGTAHVYATQANGNGDANGNSSFDTNWRAAGGQDHPVTVQLHELGYPQPNI